LDYPCLPPPRIFPLMRRVTRKAGYNWLVFITVVGSGYRAVRADACIKQIAFSL
jgi:hypothetical protein